MPISGLIMVKLMSTGTACISLDCLFEKAAKLGVGAYLALTSLQIDSPFFTLLKLLSIYVGKDSLNQYYNSYILPIFDYGCLIWGGNTAAQTNRPLKLQKRAARIILRADIMTPSQSMFDQLKWLSFPKRFQYHASIMMYKSLNNLAPDYMIDHFNKVSESHSRNLRSVENDLLMIPFSKTRYYDRSFAIQGAKQWNSLPINIRNAPSLNSFKHNVKMHLLEN